MSTTTTHYGFVLPGVNDPTDEDLWGNELNSNFSNLDTDLYNVSLAANGPISAEASVASASTVDLGATTSTYNILVTGTTTVTSFGSTAAAGATYRLRFQSALTITYNGSSLIIPGAANLSVKANDVVVAYCISTGVWALQSYTASSGISVFGGTQGDILYHNGTVWAKLGAGTAGQVLQTGGASANPSWLNFPIKAWANVNGTAGGITLGSGFSGVTRTGAGRYTATFTTTQPNANYAVFGMIMEASTGNFFTGVQLPQGGTKSTTSFDFVTKGPTSSTPTDMSQVYIQVLGT